MINIRIGEFPNREFSFFCEFQTAFELQKRGWEVYQPLIDRYIDLIAIKGEDYRTIQVKSSRVENMSSLSKDGYESYGLTLQPKDLFHDPKHLIVWVFIDESSIFNYFVFNVKDFIDVRYHNLPKSNRRKHPSLLMRGEWRWGTDRLHPRRYLKGENVGKWEVERVEINEYKNKWEKLESPITDETYNLECINATEIDSEWRAVDDEIVKKWWINNTEAAKLVKKNKSTYESSKKLLKVKIDEEDGIMDAHLLRITQEDANRIFKETAENWEVFFPLNSIDHVLLFRPVCSKCGEFWNTSLKECFYCKTKYFRIKVCENCNKAFPENIKQGQKCDCGGNITKRCISCGEVEKNRRKVFLPITFCWYCGNRRNKFEIKRFSLNMK